MTDGGQYEVLQTTAISSGHECCRVRYRGPALIAAKWYPDARNGGIAIRDIAKSILHANSAILPLPVKRATRMAGRRKAINKTPAEEIQRRRWSSTPRTL